MSTINNRFENDTLERLRAILTTLATTLNVEIIDPATGLPMTPAKDSSIQTVNTSVGTVKTSVDRVNSSLNNVNASVGIVNTSVTTSNQTLTVLNESVILLRRIAKLLEPMGTQDASQRQRVTVDTAISGNISNVTNLNTYNNVDTRFPIIDWARTAYATGIRAKLT